MYLIGGNGGMVKIIALFIIAFLNLALITTTYINVKLFFTTI